MSFTSDIKDFHEKFELKYTGKPRALQRSAAGFRQRFMQEELDEYIAASRNIAEALKGDPVSAEVAFHLEQQLDALVDLVYVALGTSYLQGFDFEEAWRRVHEANMAKVRVEDARDSKRGSSLDVIKPEGWTPPDHSDLVIDNEHT